MSMKSLVGIGVLLLALLALNSSLYVVKETERAVVLRFGRIVNENVAPGLHVKSPFVDEVRKFDGRILTLDAAPESFFTVQQKRLIVDSFVKWRIADVAHYYKSTGGDERIAGNRLAARINDGLRNQFGRRTLLDVVSGERDQLMEQLTTEINVDIRDELGIEVVDVRVKRIDLPGDVSESVFNRMAAEREKLAREYRSEGREEAEKIRADADRQGTIIAAEAYRESEIERGAGDAQAAAIYANAYSANAEFYSFMRSLQAYRGSFSNKGDVMIVSPEGEFFRYLNQSQPN